MSAISAIAVTYQPEVDGLRAVAVCAVVLFHAAPAWFSGGFVGVDVFFVISGYLITRLLLAEWQDTGKIDFLAFYARRVRRLLPAVVALLIVVLLATALLLGRHGNVAAQTGESAAAALAFVSNFYFQSQAGGYFDTPAESMLLLNLWSLSVEEQYYSIYPLFLALLLRFAPGGVAVRIAAVSLLSLGLAEYWRSLLSDSAYYSVLSRFWELAAGCLVAFAARPAHRAPLDGLLVPAGLLLILGACFFPPPPSGFPGLGALPAVVGASLVVLGVHRGAVQGGAAHLLRSPPFVGIGLVSYSLYLWHWPLLVIDSHSRVEPAGQSWRLFLCILAVGLAWLSWRYVETPFRRQGAGRPGRQLLAGALAITVLGAGALSLPHLVSVPEHVRRTAERAGADIPARMDECHFDANEEVLSLKPESCWSMPDREPQVLVWGDSHAWAWQPFARRLAEGAGASVASVTMNSCLPGYWPGAPPVRLPAHCPAMNALAMDWAARGQFDLVVVALRWPMDAAAGGSSSEALKDRIEGLHGALGKLRASQRVLVMGPLPLLPRSVPDCISLGWESRCGVPRDVHEKRVAIVWERLAELAAAHPNVALVDPTAFFCNESTCPAVRDGQALYWDTNHISATAARTFADRYLSYTTQYTRAPATERPLEPGVDE